MTSCEECGGECCKTVTVEIDEPETAEDWEEIRWFLHHKNIVVYKDNEGDWMIEFSTPCKQLDENDRCKIYEKRPKICREHDVEECEANGDGDVGDPIFFSVDDMEEYLKKNNIKF